MRGIQKVFGGTILMAVALGLVLIPERASSRSADTSWQEANAEPVPAFHNSVPAGQLPATMGPSLFSDPVAQNAYSIAARIKKFFIRSHAIATATAARATAACSIAL